MSEEEKKAIEDLKILTEYMGECYFFGQQGIRNLRKNLEILLNLIQKQSKVIDKMTGSLLVRQVIFEEPASREKIKEYFYRKVEDDE